jgi:streptogramin lyase
VYARPIASASGCTITVSDGGTSQIVVAVSTSNDASTNYSAQSTTNPLGIAWGADGALWFSESANSTGDAIGRITTAGTITNNYTAGIPANSYIVGMDAGPGGTLWFGSTCFADTFSIATTGTPGTVTTYTGGAYHNFTTGPDGALWIGESGAIGRMDPNTHVVTSYTGMTGGNL